MSSKSEREFPDKLPRPDYKNVMNWDFTALLVAIHVAAVYGCFLPQKPFLTCLYGETKSF